MLPLRDRLATGFRSLLTGGGPPPEWATGPRDVADDGYFGPGSAVWTVHADLATLVGGVRALLMQALHPAAVTGVDQHSTYRDDPLGRLSGTTRWLTVTTFGSRAEADREAARVRGLHRRVAGEYDAPDGPRAYRAADPDLLAWVHTAFTDSFLTAFELFGRSGTELPGGPDAYVRQWGASAELIGLPAPPRSVAGLERQLAGFDPELHRTPVTARTLEFLRRPPLPVPAAVGYQVLFAAASASLRPQHRELLGLPDLGTAVPYAAARTLLGTLRRVLGDSPPAARRAPRVDDRTA